MSNDDQISDAARLPGGYVPGPIDPSDLPQKLVVPETLPETGGAVVQAAVKAIGGSPNVDGMVDAGAENRVDVLTCTDAPASGFTTWSTVTLHARGNELPMADGSKLDVRVEMMAVGLPGSDVMGKILGSCAFAVLQDDWMLAPGVVYGDVVSLYDDKATTPHVMWSHPFTAPDLAMVEINDDLKVHWLMAVPITEAERQFLQENDYDALAQKLDAAQVNYLDLNRASAV